MMLACSHCVFALDPALDVSQYAHTAWKVRDGFVKGAIFAIAQTHDGYLWLGTESGLYRFDGVHAAPWQPPGGEQLPANFVDALLVARDGTLWIGTQRGLASWKDGRLSKYPEIAETAVLALLEDHEGTVWIGKAGISGGDLCAAERATIHCYGAGTFGSSAAALYEDRNNNLWVAAQTGLWRWKSGPQEHYLLPPGVSAAFSLIEDDRGALLLSTTDGLKKLVEGRVDTYALPGITGQFTPTRFLRSSDGSLWIGSWQGLLHLHQGRTDVFNAADGLSADFVVPVFEDREGNVWVGTQDGLDRFRDLTAPTISRHQGLLNSAAWSVQATTDGSIWISTADGLNRWQNGHVTIYRSQSALGQSYRSDERIGAGATEIDDSGLAGNPQSLGLDQRGRLWASTAAGVFYFESGRFIRVPGVPRGNTMSIVGDQDGDVWISNSELGLIHVTPQLVVQRIPWSQFGHRDAVALLPDQLQGALWLGFRDGGIAQLKNGQIIRYYAPADGLGNGTVSGLRLDSDGALWAATEGGLSRIKDGHITTLTSKNGLPCDAVHWLMEDDDHALWLSKPCGLVRIARSDLDAWVNDPQRVVNLTILGTSDGVRSYEIPAGYKPMVTKAPDGKILFLQRDGVGVIDPRHLPFNKLPPPVYIEQITADRKLYEVTAEDNGRLRLPALSRDLEIDFTALSLVAPEKIRFRYKLEGYDSDWQDAGNRRQAFYTNLPPRNYRFRVMACNNSGVWNETGAFLDFAIAPAYYQTLWFRLLLVVTFLTVLVLLYRLRVQQVTLRLSGQMEARVEERERIARDLHDTLLQSVQGLILKFHAVSKQLPREEVAHDALEKVLDRADEVLSEARDRVRNLRSATETPGDLPAALKRVAEEHSADRETIFKTVVEGRARPLHPLVFEESYAIGREAITNALKHSQGHHIEAEIIYEPRHFRLRVRDDGRGFDPKIFHDGGSVDHFGLRGIRERAERIGAQVSLWSGPDTGTEVELVVPGATAYSSRDDKPRRFWSHRFGD